MSKVVQNCCDRSPPYDVHFPSE